MREILVEASQFKHSKLSIWSFVIFMFPFLLTVFIMTEIFTHGSVINSLSVENGQILSNIILFSLIICTISVFIMTIIDFTKANRRRLLPTLTLILDILVSCFYFIFVRLFTS